MPVFQRTGIPTGSSSPHADEGNPFETFMTREEAKTLLLSSFQPRWPTSREDRSRSSDKPYAVGFVLPDSGRQFALDLTVKSAKVWIQDIGTQPPLLGSKLRAQTEGRNTALMSVAPLTGNGHSAYEVRPRAIAELEQLLSWYASCGFAPESLDDDDSDTTAPKDGDELPKSPIAYGTLAPERKRAVSERIERDPRVRKLTLARAGNRCEIFGCKDYEDFVTLDVHHITYLGHGGADHTDNTVALCPACHARVHRGNVKVASMLKRKLELLRNSRVSPAS